METLCWFIAEIHQHGSQNLSFNFGYHERFVCLKFSKLACLLVHTSFIVLVVESSKIKTRYNCCFFVFDTQSFSVTSHVEIIFQN